MRVVPCLLLYQRRDDHIIVITTINFSLTEPLVAVKKGLNDEKGNSFIKSK
jgi:hypothetical protein